MYFYVLLINYFIKYLYLCVFFCNFEHFFEVRNGFCIIDCIRIFYSVENFKKPTLFMEFSKLHLGTECDCISDSHQNCSDFFARRISVLSNKAEFENYRVDIELFNRKYNKCPDCCNNRSVSINIWNEDSMDFVTKKLLGGTSANLAPGVTQNRYIQIFKIKENGGLLKHTPSKGRPPKIPPDQYHYNYYTPDNFEEFPTSCLEVLKNLNSSGDVV